MQVAYNNKKPMQEPVYADQMVWQCTECHCWSRVQYFLAQEPNCPLCNSKMVQEMKSVRVEE